MADEEAVATYAKNLRRWREAIADHDRRFPDHNAWGIGLCNFDMIRMDIDEGESLWAGIVATCVAVTSGHFKVMCDGDHVGGGARAEAVVELSSGLEVEKEEQRELVTVGGDEGFNPRHWPDSLVA